MKALNDGRSVTRLTAMADLHIPNLTAVISDLRRKGVKIKCETCKDVSGRAYSKYVLG